MSFLTERKNLHLNLLGYVNKFGSIVLTGGFGVIFCVFIVGVFEGVCLCFALVVCCLLSGEFWRCLFVFLRCLFETFLALFVCVGFGDDCLGGLAVIVWRVIVTIVVCGYLALSVCVFYVDCPGVFDIDCLMIYSP